MTLSCYLLTFDPSDSFNSQNTIFALVCFLYSGLNYILDIVFPRSIKLRRTKGKRSNARIEDNDLLVESDPSLQAATNGTIVLYKGTSRQIQVQ